MNTKDKDGRLLSEADAAKFEQEELKYFKNEKAILDAPLTNRAFLAGIAYLAEAVQCGDSDFSKKAMRENFGNLRNEFVYDVEQRQAIHRSSRMFRGRPGRGGSPRSLSMVSELRST